MSLAIDPWADGPLEQTGGATASQPDLTPEEWQDIRSEILDAPWNDTARLPDCLLEAVKVLGEVGLQGDPQSRRTATQCLRAMAYRAKTGVPFAEPVEPAWSLDSDRAIYDPPVQRWETTLSDGDGDLG